MPPPDFPIADEAALPADEPSSVAWGGPGPVEVWDLGYNLHEPADENRSRSTSRRLPHCDGLCCRSSGGTFQFGWCAHDGHL